MPKLLLIDDEIKLRELPKRILELEGYPVSEAGNAHSALKILDKQGIQVIARDTKLPDYQFIKLIQRLKTQFPLVEVILLTAYGTIAEMSLSALLFWPIMAN